MVLRVCPGKQGKDPCSPRCSIANRRSSLVLLFGSLRKRVQACSLAMSFAIGQSAVVTECNRLSTWRNGESVSRAVVLDR